MEYLKAKLTRALIAHFEDDDRRIDHALTVTKFAERIFECEGGNEDVIIAAGLLHDVGIKEADALYGYNNGKLQEQYGPPIAKRILEDIGLDSDKISEICAIIGAHHTPEGVPGDSFPVIWDADMIVNLRDEMADAGAEKLTSIIQKSFKTKTGKKLATDLLVN